MQEQDANNNQGRGRQGVRTWLAASAVGIIVVLSACGGGNSSPGGSGGGYQGSNDNFNSTWTPSGNVYTGNGYAFDSDTGCSVDAYGVSC